MDKITILPSDIEPIIKRFIDDKFETEKLRNEFPNRLLRDDVLKILDRYCTLVYYPLEGEDHNNGFRLKDIPFVDGTLQDFVFINTAQRMEKQVFTAAHELGHIWNVDEYVILNMNQSMGEYEDTPENREQIVNRFAAALLIPEDEFKAAVDIGLQTLGDEKKKLITFTNLLKLIVVLMDQFYAPMKSIALRLVEFGYFNVESVERILGMKDIPRKAIDDYVDALIVQLGYDDRLKVSNKRWIDGLSDKLDYAEKNNLVSKEKIELMREKFGLKLISNMPAMDSVISLGS